MAENSKTLSLPNLLTISRIVAIPVIILLAISDIGLFRWIAFVLYALAAITDLLDGLLARIMRQSSDLGRMLDHIADKLLIGAMLLVFAWDHTFSVFDLIPAMAILLREIFIPGLREFLGTRNVIMPPSWMAKYKTTVQMIALGICMLEPVLPGLRLISDAALWLAAILTVWSGWNYWLSALPHIMNSDETRK